MGVYSKKRNDNSTACYYRFQYNGHRYCEIGGTTKTEALGAKEKRRAEKFLQRREDHASHRRDVILVNHLVRRFYKMPPKWRLG